MSADLLAQVTELAQRVRPPLAVVGSSESGSIDNATVELRDGAMLWRIVRERLVLELVAYPEFDRRSWYDADLLKRFLGIATRAQDGQMRGTMRAARELMARTIDDVFLELEELREPVAAAFNEATWPATRERLSELGYRRDEELFGRPRPRDPSSS